MTEGLPEVSPENQWYLYRVKTRKSLGTIREEEAEKTAHMGRHERHWLSQVSQFRELFAAIFAHMPEATKYLNLAEPLNPWATKSYVQLGLKGLSPEEEIALAEELHVDETELSKILKDKLPLQPITEDLGSDVICVFQTPILCEVNLDFTGILKEKMEEVLAQCADTLQWEDRSIERRTTVQLRTASDLV